MQHHGNLKGKTAMSALAEPAAARPAPILLYGAEAIAQYLGLTVREVYYQIEAGGLPVIRMGKRRITARPERIDAWLDALEHRQPS
jgi:excisionase family DNA binding protein